MTIKYKLERYVEGGWYEWGTYISVVAIVKAAALLGKLGYAEDEIRVTEAL